MAEDEQVDFSERRAHVRKSALWKAKLQVGLETFACRIIDLSLGGAGVRTDAHLLLGTRLKLVIEHIGTFKAKVAWVDDDQVGIMFTVDENEVRYLLGPRGRRLGLE